MPAKSWRTPSTPTPLRGVDRFTERGHLEEFHRGQLCAWPSGVPPRTSATGWPSIPPRVSGRIRESSKSTPAGSSSGDTGGRRVRAPGESGLPAGQSVVAPRQRCAMRRTQSTRLQRRKEVFRNSATQPPIMKPDYQSGSHDKEVFIHMASNDTLSRLQGAGVEVDQLWTTERGTDESEPERGRYDDLDQAEARSHRRGRRASPRAPTTWERPSSSSRGVAVTRASALADPCGRGCPKSH